MSGQHCENYDVKRETVHCYPRNVDRCCLNLSALFKICFRFVLLYNKSLNDWSLGEQWILFPSNLNVSLDFVSRNIEILGNKIHCSPRDQSLSVYYASYSFRHGTLFVILQVPNRFGRMRDLAFFAVIFGIWAEKRDGKWEFRLLVGAGFRVFTGLGCQIGQGGRTGYGMSIPARVTSWPTQNRKLAKMNPLCIYIAACVWFQFMNSRT